MANPSIAWRRNQPSHILTPKNLLLFVSTSFLLLTFLYLSTKTSSNPRIARLVSHRPIQPFDCYSSPQAHPVFANTVENLKFPFIYSLSDYGNLPDKPHKNIIRTLKGKPFRRPDISATVQELLEKMRSDRRSGTFVDVGANVGMASFAAAVMGFKVLAFEPVFENLQRICEGIFFNRLGNWWSCLRLPPLIAPGTSLSTSWLVNLTTAQSQPRGRNWPFKANEEVALQVRSKIPSLSFCSK